MNNLLKDEKGAWSSARVGMWVNLAAVYAVVVWTSTPSPVVMSALASIELGFMGWAAGPRIAEYLLPQIGAMAQGIASARPPHAGMDKDESGD